MNKIKSFLYLLLIACVATSCLNTETHTTPQMLFGNLYVNPQFVGDTLVGAKDTLEDHYNYEVGMVYLDTLQLGDTVMFSAYFDSYMNSLVSVQANYDTTRVNLWFAIDPQSDAVKNLLASGSNPQKGILLFNPMYRSVVFPIYIVPQEAGSHPIKITVTSDSNYSTNSAIFTMPVK